MTLLSGFTSPSCCASCAMERGTHTSRVTLPAASLAVTCPTRTGCSGAMLPPVIGPRALSANFSFSFVTVASQCLEISLFQIVVEVMETAEDI